MSKQLKYYGSSTSFSNLYSNELDGSNEYAIGNAAASVQFTGGNPLFYSVWFKPDVVTGLGCLLNIGNDIGGALTGIYVYRNAQQIVCVQTNGTRTLEIRTNNVLSAGNWFHFLWSKTDQNATNSNLYLNNVLQTKVVVTNTLLSGDTPTANKVIIGRFSRNVTPGQFDGKYYHPVIGNIAPDATQVSEIHTLKGGDASTLSFGANVKFALHYPNGTADYPIQTNYIDGVNLTMTNQESADIQTDIP